ncbi:hypothetical protein A3850_009065 [Lewinella sp. 4G2]|nr:hypothetical protein A3850_009065 [Lewinella sp. 4G2]
MEYEVTVTNNTGLDSAGIVGELTLPENVNVISVDPDTIESNGVYSFPEIPAGQSVTFTIFAQVSCAFEETTFEAIFSVQDEAAIGESGTVEVIFADLSIPRSTPATIGAYRGLETSVDVQVVNASFGTVETFTYCVVNDLTNLDLQRITVGGVDLGPPAFTQGNQDCYTVTSAALDAGGIGMTFDGGEALIVTETFLVTECVENSMDITRRVQYGCQGDVDCQEKSPSDFTATGVNYDLLAPRLRPRTVSRTRPACYIDEPQVTVVALDNSGTAPADDVFFRLFTINGGMSIDLSSIFATRADGSVIPNEDLVITGAINSTSCQGGGARRVDVRVNGANIDLGESLEVTYTTFANCDCNNCQIRNKYYSRFEQRGYTDPCGEQLNDFRSVTPSGQFDAFIRGIGETPATLAEGESGCFTYFVTNMQLDWMTTAYQDAYLEGLFDIPCGLDYVPGSMEWRDRNGRLFPFDNDAESFSYVDNGTSGDGVDRLRVRYKGPDRPSGFQYAGGASFTFCTTVDCTEKPPPTCGSAFFDENVVAQFDFTTDESCAAECAVEKIWKPADLPIRIVCTNDDPNCECDGITFTEFTVNRTNFGLGDTNNDQIPDGEIDLETVQLDRFLQGDSLRAHFEGRVRDVNNSETFSNGFVVLPIGHSDFTPLGANITVVRNGVTTTCGAVPLTPDLAGERIIADISISTLNSLGCGIPGSSNYEEGDSISVDIDFKESLPLINTQFRLATYRPDFYVSNAGFEMGTRYQCNPRLDQMNQIGFFTQFDNDGDDFGACEQPSWSIRYDRYAGGISLDEFPNEIRTIGLPERLVFTKPPEFQYRLDSWDVRLQQTITPANDILDTRRSSNPGIPAEFFIVNGDEVTFLVGDFLRSQNNLEIPPDEGYRIYFYPRIQGNCESVIGEYPYSYQFTEAVDENIFSMSEITNPVVNTSFTYQGAAQITVLTDQEVIRLCSGNDQAVVRIRNTQVPAASNSFIFPSPTGDVLVTRVEDANSGAEILPNEFGIYPLGTIGGTSERVLNVFFTKNTCADASLDFVGGWDCNGIPTTINDAICSDPSQIRLTSARSSVDMLVTQPPANSTDVISLCDPVPFEADIISSDLGFVRGIVLNFQLPPGVRYEPGTFELAVPSVRQGGTFVPVRDPRRFGRTYQQIVSQLDETLNTEGLVGSKDVMNNTVSVRFNTTTTCGFTSGQRAKFVIKSRNSCGARLRTVIRKSGRIRTADVEQDISIEVAPLQANFNACSGTEETVDVKVTVAGGLSAADSVRVLLPVGLEYVMDSYVPGDNATPGNNPTEVRQIDNQQALIFPLSLPDDAPGNMILFSVDVRAFDDGQDCGPSDIEVDAFAAFEDVCNGEVCNSAAIRGGAIATANFQKPNFQFDNFGGSIALNPDDGTATADFNVGVTNLGFPLVAGNTLQINIYDDTNGNGTYDAGIDMFLFPIDSLLAAPLNTGASAVIEGMATFPATNVCTVLAVIEPDSTCACDEVSSPTFRPDITFDYDDRFEVCSGETVMIGPNPIAGYSYEFLSRNGSPLSSLSATSGSPVTFTAPLNRTGAPQEIEYTLRVSNAPCFTDEVVTVVVAPLVDEQFNVQACIGSSYELPTTNDPEASNFVWSPMAGLTLSDGGRRATVDDVQSSQVYTLMYDVGEGCSAAVTVNLTATDCGNTNTQLGDFVWFDFNMDGIQDPNEPGVEGVAVNLINGANGQLLSSTVTDANGAYLFDMLPQGTYAVQVIAPDGFVFTIPGVGGMSGDNSDVDPETGITPGGFVPLDGNNRDFDAGLIPDCTLELDVMIGGCAPSGDTLARELIVTATWSGNPYTYDQFDDGNDTLDLMIGGNSYEFVVSELMGSAVIVDSLVNPQELTTYTVDAQFREATGCAATFTAQPVLPCVYDLALIKVPSTIKPTLGPYEYGDLICMDITVVNQGIQAVERVQVIDSLPAGLTFNQDESDLGWADLDPVYLFPFPGRLEPNGTVTTTICADLTQSSGGEGNYTNIAEINSFSDTLGTALSNFDIDSRPDQIFSNDPGGVPDSPTDDIINGDPDDPAQPNDEDDQDPYRISVYDLALTKSLDTPQPTLIGDVLTYTITVFNQGNEVANDIEVTDYIPAGLVYSPTNVGTWSAPTPGPNNTLLSTTTIPGPLAPGASTTVTIDLVFTGVFGQPTYVNRAEISDDDGDDIDSNADQNPGNDPGGAPGGASDDAVNGDGTGSPGSVNADRDEDDSDPDLLQPALVSVGSTVFLDEDGDRILNGNNTGIGGVELELFIDVNNDGVLTGDELNSVATTTTASDGSYLFQDLVPGNYQIQIPASNFTGNGGLVDAGTSSPDVAATALDNQIDDDDNGVQAGFGEVVVGPFFELRPDGEPENEPGANGNQEVDEGLVDANGDMTIDFGFLPDLTLGSTVFIDPNDNGEQDSGEVGLPNVDIQLLFDANADGVISGAETTPILTTQTDAMGNYLFESLAPGNYQVQIPTSNFGSGEGLNEAFTSSTNISTSLADNQTDGDDNGDQPGGSGTVVTSPIINLALMAEPTGAAEADQGGDQDDAFDDYGDMTIDFGFLPNVSIGSTVFFDIDNDAEQDGGENGIAGVTVELYFDANGDGMIDAAEQGTTPLTTTTDADGNYFFGNLTPGNYQVQIPASNFTGGALDTVLLSSNDMLDSDADDQMDGDDNGTQVAGPGTTVVSPVITLTPAGEPTGAAEADQGGDQDEEPGQFDASGDMTVDFGFAPNVSIGSTVFIDANDDGEQSAGEMGLDMVTVELYFDADSSGTLDAAELAAVMTTTTDADGNYYFDNLTPGFYQVQIPATNFDTGNGLDSFFVSSTDVATTAADNQTDGDDNGIQAMDGGLVTSPFIDLTPGGEPTGAAEADQGGDQDEAPGEYDASGDMTIDFGFLPNVSIGSTVFFDIDNDAEQDGGENGIAGVTVELYFDANGDGMIDAAEQGTTPLTTTTDADGNYFFGNLTPGNYQVQIPASNFTGGALDTVLLSSNDMLDSDADDQMDGDDNGTQAAGPGTTVVSPVITLTPAGEPTGAAEADQGGDQDEEPGQFDASGDMTVDFGFAPNVSIGSTVFIDANNDGEQSAGEMGLDIVTVELYFDADSSGTLDAAELAAVMTTTTDADGNYYFDNLTPGFYQVQIPTTNFDAGNGLDSFFVSSTDVATTAADNQTDGDDNGIQAMDGGVVTSPFIDLTPGGEPTGAAEADQGGDQDEAPGEYDASGDMTIDFGFLPNVSIGSTVFFDIDNDAEQDGGENGIAGVTVELYFDANGDGMIDAAEQGMTPLTTTTDADGNYFFGNLTPGNYQVQIPASNFTGGALDTVLLSSNDMLDSDADDQMDGDDNGTQVAGPGTTVVSPVITLTPAGEPTGAAEADQGGDQDEEPGQFDASGDMTVDFGFAPNVSIGSTVFIDANDDGEQSAGEMGLDMVTVELYFDADSSGTLDAAELAAVMTTTTDADGNYYFDNLTPGFYQVQIPATNFDTGNGLDSFFVSSTDVATTAADNQTDGDDNGIQAMDGGVVTSPFIDLTPGGEPTGAAEPDQGGDQDEAPGEYDASGDMTIDFGFLPNVSIGSTVFFDIDNDAEQDGGENGIAGVTVELYFDANGDGMIDAAEQGTTPLTTTTDADGNYFFGNLTPGNYQVQIPASNFTGGALDTVLLSSNDMLDSDADDQMDGDDNGTQSAGPGTTVVSPVITLTPAGEPTGAAEADQGGDQDEEAGQFDASGDMTVDFGFAPNVSIGSTVFIDANDDGEQGAGEMGLDMVTVELYFDADSSGTLDAAELAAVMTTTTDADGNYYFDNLTPGFYQVQIPATNFDTGNGLDSFFVSSTDVATTAADNQTDGDDNGIQAMDGGVVTSPFIDLTPGGEPTGAAEADQGGDQDEAPGEYDASGDMTIDFGFLPNVSIGSTVFFDIDNDAEQDGGENGIAGVTVELYFDANGDGMIDAAEQGTTPLTTTTDADGNYFFGNLTPGNYQVQIPASNFTGGALDTVLLSSNDMLDSDADDQMDGDDNGTQAAGPGTTVVSPVITLTPAGEPTGAAEADQGGNQDEEPGQFDASGDMTVDFGFAPNVSIGSTVFIDANNDGEQSAGEMGLDMVTVELYFDADSSGTLDAAELAAVMTTTTDADGNYYFDNLTPGFYQVQIPATNFDTGNGLDSFFVSSTDVATTAADNQTDGDDNGIQAMDGGVVTSPFIDLTPGGEPTGAAEADQGGDQDEAPGEYDASGDMTIDFGFLPNVSIGSTVFFDIDNDAEQDGGENGIAGVTVELYFDANGDGVIDAAEQGMTPLTTTTDADGNYFFGNLTPGNYQVQIPASNFTGGALDTVLLSSNDMLDSDADDQMDGDDNGTQAAGPGTTVVSPVITLTPAGEPTGAAEADQGGDQDEEPGQFDASGDMTVDFGFVPNVSIGSTVFIDANDDGEQSAGEMGLDMVTVELYFDADSSGTLDAAELAAVMTTTTDADGNYYFDNLTPGFYQVQIPVTNFDAGNGLDSFFVSSTDVATTAADNQTDGDDNGIQATDGGVVTSPFIDLTPGGEPTGAAEPDQGGDQDEAPGEYDASGDMTIDFGFLPNVSIGSTVFFDIDNDAEQDGGENGIAGVSVELYFDANGDGMIDAAEQGTTPLTTTTDADGNYFFGNLTPGNYQVQIPASNFAGGALDTVLLSSNDMLDSDADDQMDGDDNGTQAAGPGTTVVSPVITLTPAGEPTGAAEADQGGDQDMVAGQFDASGDMTVDFGFAPNVSIGSTVFLDQDDSSTQNGMEMGLPDVEVQLFFDADSNGVLEGPELTPVATQMTDADGNYYFDNLVPGFYQVQLPASNFNPGGPLAMSLTSSTDVAGVSDVDNDIDSDDNGQQPAGPSTLVLSPFVDLTPGGEPVGAAENGPGGDQDDLYDASGNMTIDFGFLPNVAIGSTVFFDEQNDGLLNDNDSGIADVTVQLLFDANGNGVIDMAETTPVATEVTDADGNYLFSDLTPGNYQVLIPATNFMGGALDTALLSSDATLDVDIDNQTDDDDNGQQPGGVGTAVTSPIISLLSGQEPVGAETGTGGDQDDAFDVSGDMTVDFGFAPNVSIGSLVFIDPNDNGMQEPTEPGAAGVVVELYFDADSNMVLEGAELMPVALDTTGADGLYFFDNLTPGFYQVQIPEDNFPMGSDLSEAFTSSTDDPVTSGIDSEVDNDDNGLQPGGSGTRVFSPFVDLTPGREPLDAVETEAGGMQDDTYDSSGNMTVDFGFLPNVAIGSTVFRDINNNGLQDPGEFGIAGVTLEIYFDADEDGVLTGAELIPVRSVMTDANGDYLFAILVPGFYQVQIPESNYDNNGALDTFPNSSIDIATTNGDNQTDGDDNGIQVRSGERVFSPFIELRAGQEPTSAGSGVGSMQETQQGNQQDIDFDLSGDMTVDFGFTPNVSIGSLVFIDPNDNGMQDPTEPGAAGVIVEVYFDADSNMVLEGAELIPVAMDTTGADGFYFIDDLAPGFYQVQIPEDNFPQGSDLTEAFTSSTDNPVTTNADSQVDNDDNGLQPGGSGTRVFSPFVDLTPGREPLDGTEFEGGFAQDNMFDASGDMTLDFGFLPNVAIGSTVFRDLNNNGIQDPGEFGIADVTMEIYFDADGDNVLTGSEQTPIRTIMTDANGDYLFAILVPGFYQIQIPESNYDMSGALDTFPNSSTDIATTDGDNQTDGDDNGLQTTSGGRVLSPFIELRAGQEPTSAGSGMGNDVETAQGSDQDIDFDLSGDMTVDFGFIPNVSIGSTVFVDLNDNNFEDPEDPGVPGVTVLLFYDANGDGRINGTEGDTPFDMTVTDSEGDYFFDDLPPGNYVVEISTTEFASGEDLEFLQMPSMTVPILTDRDNQIDKDNNGIQMGGPGSVVRSPVITLLPGTEPVAGEEDPLSGGSQDDEFDNAGDMTIDFGFVCNVEIEGTQSKTICSVKLADLRTSPSIFPGNVEGTYTTSGDGRFFDANEQPLTAPFRTETVAFYDPGPQDIAAGTVTLTLVTDQAGLCPPVTDSITVEILKVDCGGFFWDGNRP